MSLTEQDENFTTSEIKFTVLRLGQNLYLLRRLSISLATATTQTKMKPRSSDNDDDDDSLHLEDCVDLFSSSKQCGSKKLLKNNSNIRSSSSSSSNQQDDEALLLLPPGATECSFANSSSSSCQGSSGFLGMNDDDDEDHHEDANVVEEEEANCASHAAPTTMFDDYETFGNNGHCSWADVSTDRLVQANFNNNDDDDGPINQKNNKKKKKKKKSVRFATNAHDGSIQCTMHLVDTTMTIMMTAEENAVDACWWSKTDAMRIHAECHTVATHYRKNCPSYMDAIAGLSFSFSNTEMTELEILQYQETIAASSSVRGLEGCICNGLLKDVLSKTHQGLVLLTQYEHQQARGKDDENSSSSSISTKQQPLLFLFNDNGLEAIRNASVRTSLPSRQLALKLAEYDALEAVQAMLMPWNTNDDI